MADISAWLRVVEVILFDEGEGESEFSRVHHGLRKDLGAKLLFGEGNLVLPPVGRQVLVLDRREVLNAPRLQDVQGLPPQNAELHPVGRVVLLVELDELVADIDTLSLGLR